MVSTNAAPVFAAIVSELSTIWNKWADTIPFLDTYAEFIIYDVNIFAIVFRILLQYFGTLWNVLKL